MSAEALEMFVCGFVLGCGFTIVMVGIFTYVE